MKRTVYYTNHHVDEKDYKEVYKEFLEINEFDEEEIDFDMWLGEELSREWDDFMSNLMYADVNKNQCVITGVLGLWNGKPTIEPVVCDTILEAIKKCVTQSIVYVTVCKVNGHLELKCIHHDGTNHFEIHLLNDKGQKAADSYNSNANLNNRCYHKAMPKYLF